MTKAYAYLARIKDQEKDVIAVPDGIGRALCVSSDKHWTLTREWDELHIIAPLVENEGNDDELDPAVYVVRESDIAAVEVKRNAEGDWWTKNRGCGEGSTADGMRQMADICTRDAIEYEALARAIEAEAAIDPIEKKARELYRVATPDTRWETVADEYRRIAAHVLEQEDRDVDQ